MRLTPASSSNACSELPRRAQRRRIRSASNFIPELYYILVHVTPHGKKLLYSQTGVRSPERTGLELTDVFNTSVEIMRSE